MAAREQVFDWAQDWPTEPNPDDVRASIYRRANELAQKVAR